MFSNKKKNKVASSAPKNEFSHKQLKAYSRYKKVSKKIDRMEKKLFSMRGKVTLLERDINLMKGKKYLFLVESAIQGE